jgi:hypothetical protein
MKWVCILLAVLLAGSAFAKSRKVLVLPLEGDADATTRTRLKASVGRLARQIDGTVAVGDVVFGETAAAVGCDPAKPSCVDDVLDALAVDELVWGSATKDGGQITIVLRRATKGKKPREIKATIASGDAPERAEPALQPLFSPPLPDGGTQTPVEGSDAGSAVETDTGSGSADIAVAVPLPTSVTTTPVDSYPPRKRNMGIALSVGGGVAIVLGLALWASESSLQDQIDHHETDTAQQIADVRDLEDKASVRAWGGNLAIAAGLAVGGYGAYLLWTDHKERARAQLTPAPPPPGAGAGLTLVLRGRW